MINAHFKKKLYRNYNIFFGLYFFKKNHCIYIGKKAYFCTKIVVGK